MELYVGNFAYNTTESDLKKLFKKFGTVENVHIVTDFYTRQSKCFGYIEMDCLKEARKAVTVLHGAKLKDQRLVVKHARSCMERQGSPW